TFSPKLVARFRLQHLLDDHPPREATQLRTVSLRPQPSIDERPKPLACHLRRRYSLHHGMLPEGLRRQPKARSPASLRQGASQTFFQQIYAFTAARLSLGLCVVFLALLATLHVLEPEFNSGHLISEYQLGDYGFLMSLAFCLLGVSALLLAVSLWPRLHTRGGRIGSCWLLIIGAAFFVAGVFPPVQTPLIIGYLHGISGLVAIFGSP